MKKKVNPYPFSDSNKRYYTFDHYTKRTYGKKCAKLPLDIGCTCPNKDGSKGVGGCIYCSSKGSGDFAGSPHTGITAQLDKDAELIGSKWKGTGYIPYFQAHTNTYGDAGYLRKCYLEAASYPGAVAVSIATRADCITGEIPDILEELSHTTDVFVELGLQTASDKTAALINRCMTTAEFTEGYERLAGLKGIKKCIHLINGLPGEDIAQMEENARFVASLRPEMVKIHMLYITKGTTACQMYEKGQIPLLSRDEFVDITTRQLTLLPPDTVIGRLTGDAPADQLTAPAWTAKKVTVLNEIDKKMYNCDLWQGKDYK